MCYYFLAIYTTIINLSLPEPSTFSIVKSPETVKQLKIERLDRLLTPQWNWCSKQLTTAAADLSFYDPAQSNWKQPFWSKVDPCKTSLVLRFCRKIIMTFLDAKNSIKWSSQKPKFNVLKCFFVAFIIKRLFQISNIYRKWIWVQKFCNFEFFKM